MTIQYIKLDLLNASYIFAVDFLFVENYLTTLMLKNYFEHGILTNE